MSLGQASAQKSEPNMARKRRRGNFESTNVTFTLLNRLSAVFPCPFVVFAEIAIASNDTWSLSVNAAYSWAGLLSSYHHFLGVRNTSAWPYSLAVRVSKRPVSITKQANALLETHNLTRITVKIPDPRLEVPKFPQCTSCCKPSNRPR